MKFFFTKLIHWEFWSFKWFYIPVYFYWIYLGIKARSLLFFTASNPLMEMGGFFRYSKYNVLMNIPPQYRPVTALIKITDVGNYASLLLQQNLNYPFVVKPDKGERGKGVRIINTEAELQSYLSQSKEDIIVQSLATEPLEFGILYYRLPNAEKGTIYSVVQRNYLSVTGNGKSTVEELMQQHQRAFLYIEHIQNTYPEKLPIIPAHNETLIIEPIGNHCRGTTFFNANKLINEQLIDVFDHVSKQIQGFYFGRYDLKTNSLNDLYNGRFTIVELNGANSEPAHIYDPAMPLLTAYRDLFRHWCILYKISIQNHRKGIHYMPFMKGIKTMLGKENG